MKRASLFLACMVAGCGGDDAPPVGTGESVTVSVGAAGGDVELEGVHLTIPAGALSTTEDIVVTSTTDGAPIGYTNVSPIYQFEPAGLVFVEPITVTMAFTGVPNYATLMWSRLDGPGFDPIEGTIEANEITAPVAHFSHGFVSNDVVSVPDAAVCSLGEVPCGGGCTDTSIDPANCGACGYACPVVDGGVGSCLNGQCAAGL